LLGLTLGLGAAAMFSPEPSDASSMTYDQAVQATWEPLQASPRDRELVRYATLAANSHNSQPWIFSVAGNEITIAPDFGRRCSVVDPDDHHLFVSLGCAAENLCLAAAALGLQATPALAGDKIIIGFEPAPAIRSPLFKAITVRQCTRAQYDGRPVSTEALRLLEEAGSEPGLSLIIMTERSKISNVIDYVLQGNSAQMRDRAFMDELERWIRFNEAEAVAKMDGLFSRSSGNPSMPRWLARQLMRMFITEAGENEKYREQIESSAGVAVFVSDADDSAHRVAAGRACQRFGLQATALGLKYAFINQPVEVTALRSQFASFLGVGTRRPDLVLRFGAGPELPKSLRRPPERVMREA
jgi:hypothetical protein